jgi:hypothetical protein
MIKISNLSHRIAGINKKTLAASGPALSKEEKAELEKELENLITIDKDTVDKLKKHTEEMKSRFDDATNKIIEGEVKKIKDKALTYKSNTDPATLNNIFQILYNVCKNGDMTIPSDKKVLERLKWAIPICLQVGPKMAYLVKKGNKHTEESYKRLGEFNELINGTNTDNVIPTSGGAIYENFGVSKTVGAIGTGLMFTAFVYFFPAGIVVFVLLAPTLLITTIFDLLIMYIRDNFYERKEKKSIVSNGKNRGTPMSITPYIPTTSKQSNDLKVYYKWREENRERLNNLNKKVKDSGSDELHRKVYEIFGLMEQNQTTLSTITNEQINRFVSTIESKINMLPQHTRYSGSSYNRVDRAFKQDVEPELNKIIDILKNPHSVKADQVGAVLSSVEEYTEKIRKHREKINKIRIEINKKIKDERLRDEITSRINIKINNIFFILNENRNVLDTNDINASVENIVRILEANPPLDRESTSDTEYRLTDIMTKLRYSPKIKNNPNPLQIDRALGLDDDFGPIDLFKRRNPGSLESII